MSGKVSFSVRAQSVILLAALATAIVPATSAHAAVVTWLGNGSALWSVASNWSTTLPNSGDSLVFGASGSAGATLTDNLMTPGTYNVASITFNAGASAYTINSGTVGINGFTLTGNITNNSTNLQTINDLIALSGTQTITTATGGGNLTLGGNLSGTGGLTAAGAGVLTLGGSNSFSGPTTIAAGTLSLTNTAALANSALTVNPNATLQVLSDTNNAVFAPLSLSEGNTGTVSYNFAVASSSGTASGKTVTLANWGQFGPAFTTPTFNFSASNGYTIQIGSGASGTGALNFFNNTTINSNVAGGTVLIPGGLAVNFGLPYTLNFGGAGNISAGAITPSGTFAVTVNVNGPGTTTLTGSNTYTGTTTVSGGTLNLGGSTANGSLSASSSLSLAGGTFAFTRTGTNTQTFAATTTTGGYSVISNSVSSNTLALGTLAHTASSGGAINFINSGTISTTTANTNGILGAWATFGNTGADGGTASWASNSGGNVVAYSGYTALSSAGSFTNAQLSSSANYLTGASNGNASGSGNVIIVLSGTGSVTINSLTQQGDFSVNSGQTLVLGSGGLVLNGISRWLLNNNTGGTAGTGKLTSGLASGELFVDVPSAASDANNWRIWPTIVDGSVATQLIKDGPGLVSLYNQNTYTGGTTVNGGTLALSNGVNNGVGNIRGTLTINPGGTVLATYANALGYTSGQYVNVMNVNGGLFTTTAAGDQGYANTINLTGGTIQSNGGVSSPSTTQLLVFSGTTTVNTLASPTASVVAGRGDVRDAFETFNVARGTSATDLLVSAALTGAGGYTKSGAGIMLLSGSNTYTGATAVKAGVLSVTGSVGATTTIAVGNTSGSAGAMYQSGTSLVANTSTAGGGSQIGSVAGAFGYYNLGSGGTLNVGGEIDPGGSGGGAGTFGQLDVMPGSLLNLPNIAGSYLLANRGAAGETSVVNVGGLVQIAGGGTPADSSFNGLSVNWVNSGTDVTAITLSGTGQFLTPSLRVKLNQGISFNGIAGSSTNVANLNLNGGTLQTLGFLNGTSNNGNVSVNFNGGYLKAGTAANTTFLTGLGAAYVYAGGGTLDNNSQAITIGQSLLTPSGSGLVTGTTAVSYSSGFTVPPQIVLSGGGGSGATAYATISPTTGAVTGFVVTNPGVGYTSAPTVNLIMTGGTTALSSAVWQPTLTANVSGGMTFQGTGATTLTGFSTYGGGTTIKSGTLVAGAVGNTTSSVLPPGQPVTVNAGAVLQLNVQDGAGFWSGNPSVINLNGSLLTTNTTGSFHDSLPAFNLTGGSITAAIAGDGAGLNFILDGPITSNSASTTSLISSAGTVGLRNGQLNSGAANGSVTFTVARGSPAVDLLVASSLGNGNGTNGLIKAGGGVMELTGSNTYTGGTTVSAGTLQAGSTAAFGAATSSLTVNGGALDLNTFSNAVGPLSGTGGIITSNVAGSPVLTVNNNGASTFGGAIINGASGTPGLTLGSGSLELTGANNYTGATTIGGGAVLQIGNTATLGGAAGTALTLGSGIAAGTLILGDGNGPAGSVTVSNISAGGTSTASAIVGGPSGLSTLTVNYNSATPLILPATLGGSGANQNNLALTLTGTGTVTLSGTHNYNGPTTINAGVLSVTGNLPSTAVTVNNGGALSGAGDNATVGIVGGSVTVNRGGAIALAAANSASSLTILGSLALGGTGSYSANHALLNYSLGASGISPVDLGLGGGTTGALTLNSAGAYVNISGTPVLGTYTLMNFGSQSGSGLFSLLPGTTTGGSSQTFGRNTFTLLDNTNSLQLQITGAAAPGVAYWDGAISGNWSDLSSATLVNWSKDSAGNVDAGNIPGFNTDVIFAASSQAGLTLSTSLGANVTINSLNINASPTSTTIAADGHTLTINALADSNSGSDALYTGNAAGNGISIAAGAGAATINTPVNIGNSQTWTNASGSLLTVSGNVAATGTASTTQTLTLSNAGSGGTTIGASIGNGTGGGALSLVVNSTGSGITTLSGSNTYTAGTTLTAGSVALGNASALGTGNVTVNGGQLDVGGFSQTWPTLSGSGGLVTNNGSAGTLTINSGSFGGTIADGSGTIALSKTTTGTLALTGTNNYSGGTTLSAGLLQINSGASLGNSAGALTFNGGTLQLVGNASSSRNYQITSSHNATIDTNGNSLTLSGNLSPAGSATSVGLVKIGAGVLTLGGSNTFSNLAIVNAGTLNLTGALSTGATNTIVGGAAGNAVMQISGSLNSYTLPVGNVSGAVGAVYQTAGAVTTSLASGDSVGVGNIAGAYGFYNLSGGVLTTQEMQVGTWGPTGGGNGGSGLFQMSGGTLNDIGWLIGTRSGAGNAQNGIYNVSGGLINFATGGTGASGGFVLNWGSSQSAIVNVSGGTIATTVNLPLNLNQSGNATNTGILNLNGGVVQPGSIIGTNGTVNFNGGTLRAAVSNANFISTGSAYVYGGGATIDDAGNAITIGQALLAPSGSGVTLGTYTVSGSGFTAPPTVLVSGGGGTGATAVVSNFNASAGTFSAITITNSGVGYTGTPTFVFSGTGAGAINQSGALATAADTSGGLTKIGSGTTTLTASNSYSGPTAVNVGTLLATVPAAYPNYTSAGTVSAAAGATLAVQADNSLAFWTPANIDSLLANAAFSPSSALGINVVTGATFTYGTDVGTNQIAKGLAKLGPGLLVLNGTNTYTGTTTVSAGSLQFGDGAIGALAMSPVLGAGVVDNGTLIFDLLSNTTVGGSIGGSGGLAQVSPYVLTLAATSSYTGATNVTGGTLRLDVDNALPSTTVATFNGGILHLVGHNQSITQLIVNNSAMVQVNGSLTATLAGDGGIQIGGGTGSIGSYTMSGGSLSATAAPFDVGWFGNGTFTQSGGTVSAANYLVIGRQTGSTGNYAISGGLLNQTGGALIVAQQGTGTLTISGSAQVSTANSGVSVGGFAGGIGTGTFNLNGGTLQTTQIVGGSGASTVNFNGGTVVATATNSNFVSGLTNAVVSTSGAVINTNGNNVGVQSPLVHDSSLGSTVDGGLTKLGAGVLTLSRSNTYTGPTVIQSGTLQLSTVGLANAGFPVAAYNFGQTATGSTTINNLGSGGSAMNGTVQGGATVVSGGLNGQDALSLNGSSTSYVSIGNAVTSLATTGATWTVAGWVNTSGTGATLLYKGNGSWASGNSTFYLNNGNSTAGGTALGYVRFGGGWVTGNTAVNTGTWKQVAITDNNGTVTIYTNGVANTTTYNLGGTLTDSGGTLRIGQSPDTGDGDVPFNGLMSSLSIYSTALSAADVSALYNGGNILPASSPVQMASGATLDLGGVSQTIASLSDVTPGTGGAVTSSAFGNATLTLSPASGSTTFSGSITNGTGTVSLVKLGAGTQVLAGSSSYTGGTTIGVGNSSGNLGGVLLITNGSALGTGNVTVVAGDTVPDSMGAQLQLAGNITVNNPTLLISGLGYQAANGVIRNISDNNTINSAISLTNGAGGSVIGSDSGTLTLAGNITPVFTTRTLQFTGAGNINVTGVIADGTTVGLPVTVTGSGNVTLSAANTYTGGTTLNGGTLIVANTAGSATGTGNVTLNGGVLASTAGTVGGSLVGGSGPHIVAPGGIGAIGSLAVGGNVSVNSSTTLDFDVNGLSADFLSIGGTLSNLSSPATIDVTNIGVGSLANTYTLATFASGSSFSYTSSLSGLPGFSLSVANNDLLLIKSTGPAVWTAAGSGSWTNPVNWSSVSVPSGVGVAAIVGTGTSSPASITLDGPQTLGMLVLTNTGGNTATGYSIDSGTAGIGTLTLDNSGAASQIVVNAGNHAITAPVYLVGGDLTVSASSSSVLTISGSISQDTTRNLTLNGDGTGELVLSGTNNLGGTAATATVASGTLVLNNIEALADGTSLTVGDASFFGGIQPAGGAASAAAGGAAISLAPVPEPGTFALLAAAFGAAVAYRRLRRRP